MKFLHPILEKFSSFKFHENSSTARQVVPCGRTYGRIDITFNTIHTINITFNTVHTINITTQTVTCWRKTQIAICTSDGPELKCGVFLLSYVAAVASQPFTVSITYPPLLSSPLLSSPLLSSPLLSSPLL